MGVVTSKYVVVVEFVSPFEIDTKTYHIYCLNMAKSLIIDMKYLFAHILFCLFKKKYIYRHQTSIHFCVQKDDTLTLFAQRIKNLTQLLVHI